MADDPLRYLIIEDSRTMREWLRATVRNQGQPCVVDIATSYFEGLNKLRNKTFDIIICDYILSDERDGQQLLEECRYGKLIPSTVVWIMVTAERSYPQVVSAAELGPDDYIIKPLRPETLEIRLKQCFDKKQALKSLLDLIDQEEWEDCVDSAAERLNQNICRYRVEVLHLQAESLFNLQRYQEMAEVYLEILKGKANAPKALLGLAKAKYFLEQFDGAEDILGRIVHAHPNFLQGHDWLARVYQVKGRIEDAAALLNKAIQKNPKAINRLRETIVAMRKKNDGKNTSALYDLLLKHGGGGSLIVPSDICHQAKTLAAEKNTGKLERLKDNVRTWHGQQETFAHAVAATSMYTALSKGDKKEAQIHYVKMQSALLDHPSLSNEDKLTALDAALAVEDKATALSLAQEVITGGQDGDGLHAIVRDALIDAGHHDDASALESHIERKAFVSNSSAVKLAKEGDLLGAIEAFIVLAEDSSQVSTLLNAALAIARYGHQNQLDTRLIRKINQYLEYAYNHEGDNPKVEKLLRYSKPFLTKPEIRFKKFFGENAPDAGASLVG